jgi:hypothetical protein
MKSGIARTVKVSRFTLFAILSCALLFPRTARGAGCEQNVPIAPEAVQAGSGLVSSNSFALRFTADQGVWVKITNTTVHLTQANINISDGPGSVTYCATSMGIVPLGSVVLHAAVFGERTEFKVVVTTGAQDVAHLAINVYALPVACRSGQYYEINPRLNWNLTFSGSSLTGQRVPGGCSLSLSRQGQTWNGTLACGHPQNLIMRPNLACTQFTSNIPSFRLTRR